MLSYSGLPTRLHCPTPGSLGSQTWVNSLCSAQGSSSSVYIGQSRMNGKESLEYIGLCHNLELTSIICAEYTSHSGDDAFVMKVIQRTSADIRGRQCNVSSECKKLRRWINPGNSHYYHAKCNFWEQEKHHPRKVANSYTKQRIFRTRVQECLQHQTPIDQRTGHFHLYLSESNLMTSSNGSTFRVAVPLFVEFIRDRWIPLTEPSNAEFWCFLCCASEQTTQQTLEMLVIWDAMVQIMTSLQRMTVCMSGRYPQHVGQWKISCSCYK